MCSSDLSSIEELIAPLCRLSILERDPVLGDYPDSACEYILPEQDYVFITGMTLVNKTLPHLLVPIFTFLLASVFLKEKTSLLQKFFLLLSVAGVVFIFLSKGANFSTETASLGFVLMLGSVLANAINNILSKAKGGRYRAMDMTAVVIIVGFVTFNTLSLTSHYLEGNILAYFAPFGQLPYLLSILYLRILASIVTGSLSIYAIVRLGASTVSVFGKKP